MSFKLLSSVQIYFWDPLSHLKHIRAKTTLQSKSKFSLRKGIITNGLNRITDIGNGSCFNQGAASEQTKL
jgi:hypothetical protein